MPFALLRGATLHYQLDGPVAAPPLVLLNSLGTDLRMWDPLVPALAARHRVLRHDARGHGRSPPTPGPYSVELLARDALALVETLGLRRPHVCGLSLGGMIGLWIAAHAPAPLASLAVCNAAARMPRPAAYDERIARVRAGGVRAVADEVLAAWFTEGYRAGRADAVARARELLLGTSAEGYAAACAAVRDFDLRDAFPRIVAPTLVVAGIADPAIPPADAAALADAIPGARYLELPVAHLSALEAGPALAGRLVSFLDEVEAGSSAGAEREAP
jgi:3-oxoadipate enol-lactonase